MTTYELLRSEEVILSTVRSISNFTYLEWLQLRLSGMATNFTYLEWLQLHLSNGYQLYLPGMTKLAYFDAYNGAI